MSIIRYTLQGASPFSPEGDLWAAWKFSSRQASNGSATPKGETTHVLSLVENKRALGWIRPSVGSVSSPYHLNE
jgi:hypothetical protein